jgi:hypothetical protein
MNAPFVVAQANTTGARAGNKPLRIIKVVKPQSGEALTIHLGYEQKYKLDLSAIANEKITLVHIGERLVILFDNKATVIVEPFFDSMNAPLPNITLEAGGRDFAASEFTAIFPITSDQSVLTAAGIMPFLGTPPSGAHFKSADVDPLNSPDPLPLLGQEELPNFTVATIVGNSTPTQLSIPAKLVPAVLEGAVDEGGLPFTSIGTFGNDFGAPTSFTGNSGNAQTLMNAVSWGSAGPAAVPFQFTVSSGDSLAALGMFTRDAGGGLVQVDVASVSGNTLTAYAGGLGGIAVFTLTLNVDGSWTFEQLAAIAHSPFGDDAETRNSFDLSALIKAVAGDGSSLTLAPHTLVLTVEDDVPVLNFGFEEGESQFVPAISGLVDEAGLAGTAIGTTGNNPGAPVTATGGPGSLHSLVSFGADGPHPTAPFQFAVADGADLTGLGMFTLNALGIAIPVDTATISGSTLTALAGSIAVFSLTIHADGSWEFTQLAPMSHAPFGDNGGNGNEFDLSGLIKAVDYDGDSVAFLDNFKITVRDDCGRPPDG